jgi:thiol:disulfide interchange protein/DsbC/DsbD-like thiol-disulfide interchange protein
MIVHFKQLLVFGAAFLGAGIVAGAQVETGNEKPSPVFGKPSFLSGKNDATAGTGAQAPDPKSLVKPSLVADTTAIEPGKPFTVGLLLKMAPHWHTYWQYPGDSGMPTRIDWQLPSGFLADPIQWPIPKKSVEPGDLVTYGYDDEVMLLVKITPPKQLGEREITLSGHASWLVCEKICIPGDGGVSLTLPIGKSGRPANGELFEKYRAQLPKNGNPPFDFKWSTEPNRAVLELRGIGADRKVDFFPMPPPSLIVEHPQIARESDGAVKITVPISTGPADQLTGLVMIGDGDAREGWPVPSASGASAAAAATGPSPAAPVTAQSPSLNPQLSTLNPPTTLNLLRYLLFGFIGGFLLNLMPCVLPVISLKIFGFIKQAGEEPRKIFRLGLAFVAGIFAWFLALATLMIAFKLAGRELTWAFQFQNSYFLVGMCAIVLVFALNLFGVFEIVLPSAAGSKALDLSQREGYAGAFFHGVFATLLATPCTAPFLGSALGFALAQSPLIIFIMFAAVASGMSLPYFALTAQPAWMRYLPKPGTWMVRLKQFMGFLLFGTVIWLLGVLGDQRGVDAIVWTSCFLLALGLACWIKGQFAGFDASPAARTWAMLAIVAIVAASGAYFIGHQFPPAKKPEQTFSQVLQNALGQGRTVFVDFTASWCVNCKTNERLVLGTAPVQDAFKKDDVIFLKADWSNGDPDITALLRKFGKAGVPAYVIFPAGKADEPIVLPEILTQQIVFDGLAEAKRKRVARRE